MRGPAAPSGAALGTSGKSPTPPLPSDQEARRSKRLSRHALKATQRKVAHSRASRYCWYPSAGQVVVDVSAQAIAHVSQVHRCGSPWACPVCAPVIRQRRAEEVEEGLTAHLAAGGGAEFVTTTVPHYAADQLAPRLKVIGGALGQLLSGAPWDRRRARLGYVGSIRALEITYGANGWHPHLHAVLLFERPLTAEERAELTDWLRGRWAGIVARKGFGKLHHRHGVDVRPVTSSELGDYLTKVEGGWTAGMELTRSDLKSGGKGLTPFQLLYELAATGESRWLRLWQEYERATHGLHSIQWSAGLKKRLLGRVPDKSDTELAASEGAGLTVVQVLFAAEWWRDQVRAGTVGLVLDDVERAAELLFGLLLLAGHVPQALDKGGG